MIRMAPTILLLIYQSGIFHPGWLRRWSWNGIAECLASEGGGRQSGWFAVEMPCLMVVSVWSVEVGAQAFIAKMVSSHATAIDLL